MIIDVAQGEGWDSASRTVLGPVSRRLAASRDATGGQYAGWYCASAGARSRSPC
ncbi:hypothetical protein [Streptomyces sp. NPDC055013]